MRGKRAKRLRVQAARETVGELPKATRRRYQELKVETAVGPTRVKLPRPAQPRQAAYRNRTRAAKAKGGRGALAASRRRAAAARRLLPMGKRPRHKWIRHVVRRHGHKMLVNARRMMGPHREEREEQTGSDRRGTKVIRPDKVRFPNGQLTATRLTRTPLIQKRDRNRARNRAARVARRANR